MIFLYSITLALFLMLYLTSGIHRSFWTKNIKKITTRVPHRLHALFEVGGWIVLIVGLLSPVIAILLFCWYLESIGSYIP